MYGNDIKNRAKAKAAAGSDARMNGCELPVIIVSGSGNQGLTVSVPVIEYAKEYNIDSDTLYRALVLSNLIAIYLKNGIGSLSAFCGAVCAGCASGAAIYSAETWMLFLLPFLMHLQLLLALFVTVQSLLVPQK